MLTNPIGYMFNSRADLVRPHSAAGYPPFVGVKLKPLDPIYPVVHEFPITPGR
jgi:hypothetical protein